MPPTRNTVSGKITVKYLEFKIKCYENAVWDYFDFFLWSKYEYYVQKQCKVGLDFICFDWKVGGDITKYSQVIGWESLTEKNKNKWWWNKFQSEIASKFHL